MQTPTFSINHSFIFGVILSLFLLVVSLSIGVQKAEAATKTWVGTTGGSWTTNGNWSPSGQPVVGDDVIIPADQSAPITGVPDRGFKSVTIGGNVNLRGGSTNNRITATSSLEVAAGKTLTLGSTNSGGRLNITLNGNGILFSNAVIDVMGDQCMGANKDFTVSSSGTLTLYPGAMITDTDTQDCATKTPPGTPVEGRASIFNLNSGASLIIGHVEGIAATGDTGAIRLEVRNFNSGAHYIYNGTANQSVGSGLPGTVSSLTINNTGGSGNNTVTLANSLVVSNNVEITAGILGLGSITTHTAATLSYGATPQLPGTYGSESSTAYYEDNARFAGTGILSVGPVTSLEVEPATGSQGGGPIDLTATLTPALSGKTINFSIDGDSVGSAPTDGDGVATLENVGIGSLSHGVHEIKATFAGETTVYSASSGTADLTVTGYSVEELVLSNVAQTATTTLITGGIKQSVPAEDALKIAPGAPVVLTMTVSVTGDVDDEWNSVAYRFNRDELFGTSYFCVPRDGNTVDEGDGIYTLTKTITQGVPVSPTGIRYFQMKTFSETNCNAGAPGSTEWTGAPQPTNYANAVNVTTVGGGTPPDPEVTLVAVDNEYTTLLPMGTALIVSAPGVLGNDTIPSDVTSAIAVFLTNPSNGTLSATSTSGGFTYTPNSGYHGEDSFTYSIVWTRTNGQTGTTSPATVDITVSGRSTQALTLTNLTTDVTVDLFNSERTALPIAPGGPVTLSLTMKVTGLSEWGSTAYRFNSNTGFGSTSFCINRDENTVDNEDGTYTLTATLSHGVPISPAGVRYFQLKTYASSGCGGWTTGGSPTNYANAVNVTTLDADPGDITLGADDSYSVSMGSELARSPEAGVLSNDNVGSVSSAKAVPPDGFSCEGPCVTEKGGSFILYEDGAFTYMPADGFHGIDTFEYRVEWMRTNGQTGTTSPITVSITVNGISIKEVKLVRGDDTSVTLHEDGENTHPTNISYEDTLALAPGAPVTLELTANITGDVEDWWTGLGYRFNRTDNLGSNSGVGTSFSCVHRAGAIDNEDGTYTQTYTILNTPVSPEGLRNFYLRLFSGEECEGVSPGALVTDNASAWTGNGGPTIYWRAINTTNADAPGLIAVNDSGYSVVMGGTLNATQSVLANDAPASPPRTATLVEITSGNTGPTLKSGTVTLASDGTFTYNPASNFHGIDSFQYRMNYKRINGSDATTSPATVFIVVGTIVADADFDFSAYGVATSTATTTVNVPQSITLNANASSGTVVIEIPGNTNLTAGTGSWDGIIDLTPVVTSSVSAPSVPGQTSSVVSAIEIGLGDTTITFDQAIKLTFLGHGGKLVGWTQGGTLTPITAICGENSQGWANDNLAPDGDCKISNVGGNLVVWTKHLTTYAVYTQAPVRRSSGGGGGGSAPLAQLAATASAGAGCAAIAPLLAQLQLLIQAYLAQGGTLDASTLAMVNTLVAACAAPVVSPDVRDLTMGMEGEDVRALQQILIGRGYSIPPGATGYFGTYTRDALAAYQRANGIVPAVGYFGPTTRAQMKAAGVAGIWW